MLKRHKIKTKGSVDGAPSVDIMNFLPAVFVALFGVGGEYTLYSGVYYWTMLLIWFNFALRPSELLEHCPHVEGIKYPNDDEFYDKDDMPK